MQHCLRTLGFAGLERCSECPHGIHTLSPWAPAAAAETTHHYQNVHHCLPSRKENPRAMAGPLSTVQLSHPGPGRAPRLLPPRSGPLWDAANRVTRPGFLNAAQHSHTLGEFLTGCVRAGKVVYILCLAWKRPWLT